MNVVGILIVVGVFKTVPKDQEKEIGRTETAALGIG